LSRPAATPFSFAREPPPTQTWCVNQKALIERLISVACAATWDFAFGNPSPTDDEIQALAKEMAGAK
jgi:hypothetical protein